MQLQACRELERPLPVVHHDAVYAEGHQMSLLPRRAMSSIAAKPSCTARRSQNACAFCARGMCVTFMPHMPLTTTNGMLIVAMTDNPLVIWPSLLETCDR